ncbi:hypothetical protein [Campylobacter sp. MG1]|uniref:hypothetical protein n=1 Tax=Campylobacter sp. MG1 TaxID=2976332 RepID=UPI00226CD6FD|nr:hypothetical protein [Campylobacter sp. MG1]
MYKNDNEKVIFIQELYETYKDIKNNNLTLTRIYVIIILSLMFSFAVLGMIFLFLREFMIAGTYFVFTISYIVLLLNRKKKVVAKHLSWFCFIMGGFSIMIAIAWNIYLFGAAGGAQLYVLLLASLVYTIYINSNKKRKITALISYIILVTFFVSLMIFDSVWHKSIEDNIMSEILFTVSICIVLAVNVFGAYTVGLKSIEYVESVTNQKINFYIASMNNRLRIMNKKDLSKYLIQNQILSYNNLNICMFEFTTILKNMDNIFQIDYFSYEKIINQFYSLLRIYFPSNELIIRWDLNSIILIIEENSNNLYFLLESISNDFDKKIKRSQTNYDLYLKVIAKNYKFIDGKKKHKILLEKINEIIKLKYETKTIGKEYILYEYGDRII